MTHNAIHGLKVNAFPYQLRATAVLVRAQETKFKGLILGNNQDSTEMPLSPVGLSLSEGGAGLLSDWMASEKTSVVLPR